MLRKVPLIIILGSTGTGKTKLSLELAERFGSEIISADSMQVYANLNIVTAKVTREEQARVRHHLLDVATVGEPYTVFNFRNAALPILQNLLDQSRCPIVVGGTNYYIESLLWDILINSEEFSSLRRKSDAENTKAADPTDAPAEVQTEESERKSANEPVTARATNCGTENRDESLLSTLSSKELYQNLLKIDPDSAKRLHPNNKRKIIRALEVYQQSGQTLTQVLEQQRQKPGGNRLGGPLRYPHTILLWLRCSQNVLNERLEKRIDLMLEQGLLREIREFHTKYKCDKSAESSSYTKGILQTIGFKEFVPYLEKFSEVDDREIEEYLKRNAYQLPSLDSLKTTAAATRIAGHDANDDLPPPNGLNLLSSCLEELKLVTKRYSKKQIKWINNRLLASKDRQVPDLYELDTTNVDKWHEMVYERAVTVINCYREGRKDCEVKPMPKRVHPSAGLNEETSHFCNTCERHFVGDFQWKLHLKSNKHKRRKEGRKDVLKRQKLSVQKDEVEHKE